MIPTFKELREGAFELLSGLFPKPSEQDLKDSPESERSGSLVLDPFSYLQNQINLEFGRSKRYQEYNQMEDTVEIATGLDIYADEATQPTNVGDVFWVTSPDSNVEKIANDLFKRIGLKDMAWSLSRAVAKYGGVPMKIIKRDDKIIGLRGGYVKSIHRVEKAGILVGYNKINLQVGGNKIVPAVSKDVEIDFDPWDFIHFRIGGTKITNYVDDVGSDIMGCSIIEPARKHWKKLQLLETSVMVNRITRSASRRIWKIYTGEIGSAESDRITRKWEAKLRSKRYLNPQTNDFTVRHNPLAPTEDIVWPVNNTTKDGQTVEELGGIVNVTGLEDIYYFQLKVLAAMKFPAEFANLATGNAGGLLNTSLGYKDIRFARSVYRLQKAMFSGLVQLVQIQLALSGIDPLKSVFQVHGMPVSNIAQMQRVETVEAAVRLGDSLIGLGASLKIPDNIWLPYVFQVIKNYMHDFGLLGDDIEKVVGTKKDDENDNAEEFGDLKKHLSNGNVLKTIDNFKSSNRKSLRNLLRRHSEMSSFVDSTDVEDISNYHTRKEVQIIE